MALNFGLGFSFGAKDAGLSRAITSATKDFQKLGKEILGLQRIQTFLSALSFEKLDSLNDKLQEIGNSGLNLTTSLEATFTSFAKETKQFGATVGKSGAELSKFSKQASSMAYSLNIGADAAGKAIYGFEAAAGDLNVADILKATGIESAQAFAKFTDVAGVSGDDFAYSLLGLGKAAGLSAAQVGRIANKAAEFGTNANLLGDSLGSMEELTSILQERTNLGENADATGKFGEQIFSLANNLYAVTGQGKEAKEAAFALAKTLTESKKGFKDLMAGVSGADLTEFTKQFSVVAGEADAAFAAMDQGPEAFLKSVASVVDGLSSDEQAGAIEFFRSRMQAVFGDSTDLIVGMLQDAEKRSSIATMEIAKDATTNLGKIAKEGFSTGLTTAEAYSRMQDSFEARLRAKTTVSTKLFLKRARESFREFDKFAAEAIKQGGLQGAVVETVANLQKFGAMAIIPANLQGEFSMLGTAIDKLSGPIAKLNAMGIKLSSPMGLISAGFGALAINVASAYKETAKFEKVGGKRIERSFTDRFDEALANVGKRLLKFVDVTLPKYVRAGVKSLANALRTLLTDGLSQGADQTDSGKVAASLAKSLKKSLIATWEFLKDAYKGFVAGLTGTLDANKASDAQVIGGFLSSTLVSAFNYVKSSVESYLKNWWTTVTNIWSDGSLSTMEALKKILANSIPVMLVGALALMKLGPVFGAMLSIGIQLGLAIVTPIISAIASAALTALSGLWTTAIWPFITGTIWPAITGAVSAIVGVFGWWLIPIIGGLVLAFEAFRKEGESVSDAFSRLLSPAVEYFSQRIDEMLAFWDGLTDGFMGWADEIITPLSEAWRVLEGTMVYVFGVIGQLYDQFFGSTQTGVQDTVSMWSYAGDIIGNVLGFVVATLADAVKYISIGLGLVVFGFAQLPIAVQNAWMGIKYYFGLAVDFIQETASAIKVSLIGAFNAVGNGITAALNFVMTPIRKIADMLAQVIGAIASSPSIAKLLGLSASDIQGIKAIQGAISGFSQGTYSFQNVSTGAAPRQAATRAAPNYLKYDSFDANVLSPALNPAPTTPTVLPATPTNLPVASRSRPAISGGPAPTSVSDPALLNATNNPTWASQLMQTMTQGNQAIVDAINKSRGTGTTGTANPKRAPLKAGTPVMTPAG